MIRNSPKSKVQRRRTLVVGLLHLAALLIVVLLALTLQASANRPPQAGFTYYPPSEQAELTINTVVTFDASPSFDPDGRIIKYEWDFEGDGIYDLSSSSPATEWLYDNGGNFRVSLRVTDDDRAAAIEVREIEVGDAPVAVRQTISAPISPNQALPGDWIEVSVEISFHETVNGPALKPELPEGWRIREVDSDGFTFKRSELVWVLIGQGLLGDRLRITYQVLVPEDAAPGLYTIGGLVSSFSPRFVIPIPKDVEVQVL